MNEELKELIAIGASVAANCQPCLAFHVGKARELGVSEDEIREAVEVGSVILKVTTVETRKFATGVLEQKPTENGWPAVVPPNPACAQLNKKG